MGKKPVVATQIRTTQKILDDLDVYAEKMGLSRNQLMNNLILIGLEDLAVLRKLGLIRVGVGIRNLIDSVRDEREEIKGHIKPV